MQSAAKATHWGFYFYFGYSLGSNLATWFFFKSSSPLRRLSISSLRYYILFSFVWSAFIIAHWSIFTIALKSSSDNSKTYQLYVSIYWLSFLIWGFLILFWWVIFYWNLYIWGIKSLVLAGFLWYHSGRKRERCHLITIRWRQKSRFPTVLIPERGGGLSSLLLSRAGSPGSPLCFHWYYPLSWVQQKCLLTIPHMASRHQEDGGMELHTTWYWKVQTLR